MTRTLQIQAGVDLSGAAVYARDLVFLSPQGSSLQTKVGQAYYYNSLQMTPQSVLFINPAIKLAAEPNLATIDASMRQYYLNWAGGTTGDILPLVSTTLGVPSNPYGVFFAPGNLTLGSAGTTITITQPLVIYVAGAVAIHSNIVTSGNGWLAPNPQMIL